MSEENCIFCKLVKGEIPSKIVFENDDNLAFLDINPVSEGHTIVIPKKHFTTLEKTPEEEVIKLFLTVKEVAEMIYTKLDIDGYNVIQNNYKAAGQHVDHSHVHIIPRSNRDMKIRLTIPRNSASNEELEKVLKKIKS